MQITLYSDFSKRRNSTKNPTSPGAISVSVTKDVTLKGRCDYLRPSFFLADVTGFVYLKAWNNYYYIRNVAYDIEGHQYIDCEIDVLGTWRDVIMATRAFVKYSTSDFNVYIKDERVVPTAEMSSFSISLDMTDLIETDEFDDFADQFLLTCYTQTGLKSYLMDLYQVRAIITQLVMNSKDLFGGGVDQYFSDARDAIVSLRVVPFKASALAKGAIENVFLGTFDTQVRATPLESYCLIVHDGLPVGSIKPTDFRIQEPYTYCKLYLPLVGLVDFSLEEMQNHNTISYTLIANIVTGKVTYIIYTGSGNVTDDKAKILGIYDAECGFEIPVATGMLENPVGFVTSSVKGGLSLASLGIGATAAAASGGALAGVAVAGGLGSYLLNEMNAFIAANKQNISITGGFAGNFGWGNCRKFKLEVFQPVVSDDPDDLAELYGRPLLQVRTIGDLSGYVETKGFDIDISALEDVKDMINKAMDSGVYLE